MRRFIALAALLAIGTLLAFSSWLPNRSASAGQGKGGEVIAKPTPTPKKTTTKRNTPARTTSNSKTSRPAKSTSDSAAAAEIIFWNSIKDSTNPEEFRAYLKKYPNGEFADIARSRLNALETAAKEKAAREEEARREDAKREETKRKEEAEKKRVGTVVRNSIGMDLVYIPSGSFVMGSPESEVGREDEEGPQHQVTVQAFYMGKYEVTQAQWQKVMGTTFREKRDKVADYYRDQAILGDAYPMSYVEWEDAQKFVGKLNAMNDGYTYRLPTEAEWEYASRAGTSTRFYWGDDEKQACKYANFVDQSYWEKNPPGKGWCRDGYAEASPVGSFQPNAFGLYDMTGNVMEICEDLYHKTYHGAPTDGSAWFNGGEEWRVQRGGGWHYTFETLRSAYRTTARSDNATGFRVVAVARTQ